MLTGTLYGTPAPEFSIETLDGTMLRSTTLLDRGPIFLDFWATWCRPCLRALPHINNFVQQYPDLNVIAVSIDEPKDKDKVIQLVRRNRYEFITGFDSTSNLRRIFNVSTVPRTIIISQTGEIVYDGTGYNPGDEVKYDAIIQRLFQEGSE
jgi:thiol-disulfide isomerase/thioredoxin